MGTPMHTALTRRTVLAGACGACAAAVAGCAGYGPGTAPAPAAAAVAGPLAALADVPVGGGLVLAAQDVVLTQPVEGEVRAFSATCTHQGCLVADVSGGTINCTCHGSSYDAADGTVVAGPAPRRSPPAPSPSPTA